MNKTEISEFIQIVNYLLKNGIDNNSSHSHSVIEINPSEEVGTLMFEHSTLLPVNTIECNAYIMVSCHKLKDEDYFSLLNGIGTPDFFGEPINGRFNYLMWAFGGNK